MKYWALLLFFPFSAQAVTYICVINGQPVYTTIKQAGQVCEISNMNGIVEHASNHQNNQDNQYNQSDKDEIYHIWHEYEYGSYDKTPILPRVANTETSLPKPMISQNKNPIKTTPKAPSVSSVSSEHLPFSKVILNRRSSVPQGMMNRKQILQQEIQRENMALQIAREQLANARKRGDADMVKRLSMVVLDREQNLMSLRREIKR